MTERDLPFSVGGATSGRLALAPVGGDTPAHYDGSRGSGQGPAPIEVNLLDYWRMMVKRRVTIGICVLVFLSFGLAFTLLSTPLYRASATVQVEREAARLVHTKDDNEGERAQGDDLSFYSTQIQLLQSRALAQRVVRVLGLSNNNDFLTRRSASPIGQLIHLAHLGGSSVPGKVSATPEQRESQATNLVAVGLHAEVVRGSHIFKISYSGPDPNLSAAIANAFADQFIQSNLDRRFEASNYARAFLDNKLQDIRNKLEDSERRQVAYAQAQQIIDVDEGKPLSNGTLESLNTAVDSARDERIKAQALWEQARNSSGLGLPQVESNAAIQQLEADKGKLASQYQEGLQTYNADYPKMQQIKAQIDEVNRQIQAQVNDVKTSLQSQYVAAAHLEQMLSGQLGQAKTGSLDLRERSIQYDTLQREVDTNKSLYDGLLQSYKEVGIAGGVGTNNISIVDRALAPNLPYQPNWLLNLGLATLLGALVGGAVAFALEHVDESLRVPQEIEQRLGLPLLGATPALEKGVVPAVALADFRSPFSEAHYSIRTALQFATGDGVPQSLLVTSSRPGEGKSTTTVALSRCFAQLGMRVLVIDADLRNPSIHRLLGGDNAPGLSNCLAGGARFAEVVKKSGIANLWMIPSGPLPPNPTELLAGKRLGALLAEAQANFDLVLIDGPPVVGLADATLLSSVAVGTMIVIEAGQTRLGFVNAALQRLRVGRGRIIGAIMTKFDAKTSGYSYGYGYGYGYGDADYRYKAAETKPKLVDLQETG